MELPYFDSFAFFVDGFYNFLINYSICLNTVFSLFIISTDFTYTQLNFNLLYYGIVLILILLQRSKITNPHKTTNSTLL